MTKRIVSGVFLLIALGALGLILAGALTSGEQLIVRFLTAVIVAALALYVISDLRLQREGSDPMMSRTVPPGSARVGPRLAGVPANSTAAFMATVTGKRTAAKAAAVDTDEASEPRPSRLAGAPSQATAPANEGAAITLEGGVEHRTAPVAATVSLDDDERQTTSSDSESSDSESSDSESSDSEPSDSEPSDDDNTAERLLRSVPGFAASDSYSDVTMEVDEWPPVPEDAVVVDGEELAGTAVAEDDIDGLVAIFTKQAEQELEKTAASAPRPELALAARGSQGPELAGDDRGSSFDAARTAEPAGESSTLTLGRVMQTLHSTPKPAGSPAPRPATPAPATAGDAGSSKASADGEAPNGGSANDNSSIGGHPIGGDPGWPKPTVALVPDGGPVSASRPVRALEAAGAAHARIIDLRLSIDATADIEEAIRSGEVEVISSLIEKGVLSADGPISNDDVQTMVYVAFTSNELRKILRSGGIIDGDASDIDLGPVEVFTEESHGAILRLSVPGSAPAANASAVELGTSTIDLDAIDLDAIDETPEPETDENGDSGADEASAAEETAEAIG